MTDIADINRQLAAKTSSFLLECLSIGSEVAEEVLQRNRQLERGSRPPMDAGEELRLRCGFTAAGLVIDALEAEGRRQRLGMQSAFHTSVLAEFERSAQYFAQYARALELQGEQFLFTFYNKLSARLQHYYASQDRPKVLRRGEAPDDSDGLPQPRLRGEPTAQRGYESIARKTGRYEEIRHDIKNRFAEAGIARADAPGESGAAVMEEEPPAQASPETLPETLPEAPPEMPPEKPPEKPAEKLPAEAAPEPQATVQQTVVEGRIEGELGADHVDEMFHDRTLTKLLVEWYRDMHDWFNSSGQSPPPTAPPRVREVARQNRKANPQTNLLLDFEEQGWK